MPKYLIIEKKYYFYFFSNDLYHTIFYKFNNINYELFISYFDKVLTYLSDNDILIINIIEKNYLIKGKKNKKIEKLDKIIVEFLNFLKEFNL